MRARNNWKRLAAKASAKRKFFGKLLKHFLNLKVPTNLSVNLAHISGKDEMTNRMKDIPFADGASLAPSIGHYDSTTAPLSGRAPKLSPTIKPHTG